MNKLCIFLITAALGSSAFAALPPTKISRPLQLLIEQAAELDAVLTLDKEFYEKHIYDRERSEEFRMPLMAEFVAQAYLIPSIQISVALIKQLAQQETTDPEMNNLKLAVAAIPSLELKYLRATYAWDKDKSYATPVHPKADSKPCGSQQMLIKSSTRLYQTSMGELLHTYKERRKESQEKDQRELARLQDKLAEVQQ